MMRPINLCSKFNSFSDCWSPKVIAEMNDYQFKLVKIKGEFILEIGCSQGSRQVWIIS